MLTYPKRSDQKRRAIIIIYEKPICFVTASCYSSCYHADEELQYFAFWFLSMQWILKKRLLLLYFCLGPLAALHNTCNSANRSNNTTKYREVFQKTQHTQGTCSCKGFVINGVAKGTVPSDTIFYRCRSEGAMNFLSESQVAYERGRNQNYALLLERKYSVGCKHWSTAFRYLKGSHILFTLREVTLF